MRYLAYLLLIIAWLFTTVLLVWSVIGLFVLILSQTWWEIPKLLIKKIDKKDGWENGNS